MHIGGNCDLDKEMNAFAEKVFQPTEVVLRQQEVKDFGDTAIVISDVDYCLLLDGKPTTHHINPDACCGNGVDAYIRFVQFACEISLFLMEKRREQYYSLSTLWKGAFLYVICKKRCRSREY